MLNCFAVLSCMQNRIGTELYDCFSRLLKINKIQFTHILPENYDNRVQMPIAQAAADCCASGACPSKASNISLGFCFMIFLYFTLLCAIGFVRLRGWVYETKSVCKCT